MMMLKARRTLHLAVRWGLWFTPFRRYIYHRYQYAFTPEQLSFLVNCINQTRDVAGMIYEIGCAGGATTVFLNKHLESSSIDKKYICLDTFKGFTTHDVSWEVLHRGKRKEDLLGFERNSPCWFRYTMKANACARVMCVVTDVQEYTFREKVSFCLLDVDLYRPTLHALQAIWPLLEPGGIIVVDDCLDGHTYDGAFQAYIEFTRRMNLPQEIVLQKLGVIARC